MNTEVQIQFTLYLYTSFRHNSRFCHQNYIQSSVSSFEGLRILQGKGPLTEINYGSGMGLELEKNSCLNRLILLFHTEEELT